MVEQKIEEILQDTTEPSVAAAQGRIMEAIALIAGALATNQQSFLADRERIKNDITSGARTTRGTIPF